MKRAHELRAMVDNPNFDSLADNFIENIMPTLLIMANRGHDTVDVSLPQHKRRTTLILIITEKLHKLGYKVLYSDDSETLTISW